LWLLLPDTGMPENELPGTRRPQSGDASPPIRRRTPMPWAQLLHRVFFISAMRCPRCSGAMVILAFLSDPPVFTRILRHLRLPTVPPPVAPARGSGAGDLWGLNPPREADLDDGSISLEVSDDCHRPLAWVPHPPDGLCEVRPPP